MVTMRRVESNWRTQVSSAPIHEIHSNESRFQLHSLINCAVSTNPMSQISASPVYFDFFIFNNINVRIYVNWQLNSQVPATKEEEWGNQHPSQRNKSTEKGNV